MLKVSLIKLTMAAVILAMPSISIAENQNKATQQPAGWIKQFIPTNVDKKETVPEQIFSVPSDAGVDLSKELGLEELIELSLSINTETKAAWHLARQMSFKADESKGLNYPKVNIGVEVKGQNQYFQGMEGFATQNVYVEPYISVSYLILDFGKRAGEIEAARQRMLATQYSFNTLFQNVIYRVEKTYFEYQMVLQAIEASKVNLKLAESVDESARAAFENGLGTVEAVMDARRIKARAVYELEQLLNAGKVSLGEVAIMSGLPSNYPLKVAKAGSLTEPGALIDGVDKLISTALVYKPEMSEKYAQVREEEARINAARAELYPALYTGAYLGASINHFWVESPPQYASYNKIYPDFAVALAFNYELFDGSARKNRLAAAEESAKTARERLSGEQLVTVRGAWNAYYRYMTAKENLKFAVQLVETAKISRDSTAEGFKNGLNTVVESIAAERDLAEAEMIHTNALADLYVASAAVALATGTIGKKN